MKLSSIKLVTIIGPKRIKNEILSLLKAAGIRGYTYYFVFGGGERQLSGDNPSEAENVKFRILVPNLLAVSLMKAVADEYFGKEKVITFEHDANVIRHEKFDKVEH